MKTSLSAVKRIGQRFETKSSVNRKVCSGRPRASTIKDDHRLKVSILKTFVEHSKKNSLSRLTISRMKETIFLLKRFEKKVYVVNKIFPSKQSFQASGSSRAGFPKLFIIIAPLAKIFKIVPPFYSTYRPLTS